MVNLINFYKTQNNEFGLEIKYQDKREDIVELRPVETLTNIVNIMSDDHGSELYSGINRVKFSAGFMTEEINILEKITHEYVKASNEINKLKKIIENKTIEEYLKNEKTTNSKIPETNLKDISKILPKEILTPYVEQMSRYVNKLMKLEKQIQSKNKSNYLK